MTGSCFVWSIFSFDNKQGASSYVKHLNKMMALAKEKEQDVYLGSSDSYAQDPDMDGENTDVTISFTLAGGISPGVVKDIVSMAKWVSGLSLRAVVMDYIQEDNRLYGWYKWGTSDGHFGKIVCRSLPECHWPYAVKRTYNTKWEYVSNGITFLAWSDMEARDVCLEKYGEEAVVCEHV